MSFGDRPLPLVMQQQQQPKQQPFGFSYYYYLLGNVERERETLLRSAIVYPLVCLLLAVKI